MAMPIRNREKFDAQTLLADVKEHAATYQGNGRGWDLIVNGSYDDADLLEIIGGASSKYGARNRVYREVQALRKLEAEDQKLAA